MNFKNNNIHIFANDDKIIDGICLKLDNDKRYKI